MTRKGNRLKLMFSLDMWSTAEFIEKTLIRCVNAFQLWIAWTATHSNAGGRPFQNRQVSRHRIVSIRKPGYR